MNQKCIPKIEKVASTLAEVCDALDQLKTVIERDADDEIDGALDMFPGPRILAKALEDLGMLIQGRPWEGGRKRTNG